MERESLPRLSDGELLILYIDGDKYAYGELVDRYRLMVLRVCRQVLDGSQEAEDASQQVFHALSAKARELLDRESIGSWLYRTAGNISNRMRRARCIRRGHEISAAALIPHAAPIADVEPDTTIILHQALNEIPEIYREALILHYFRGYTVAKTAAHLGCPAGTVAARISRGLERLRSRLSDRQLILSVVAIKLLMLGLASGTKAAAAAVVPTGGRPSSGRGYGYPTRNRFSQCSWAAGLLPVGLSLPAFGQSMLVQLRGLTAQFTSLTAPKKVAMCFVFAIVCAGAGTATAGVLFYPIVMETIHKITTAFVAPAAGDYDVKKVDDKPPAKVDIQKLPPNDDDSNRPSHTQSATGGVAVPEPGSLTLLLGGAALSFCRRGNRQVNSRAAEPSACPLG